MKFRLAERADVPALVVLLSDDPLGATREGSDLAPYLAAFDEISANPMHQLLVAERAGRVIATCQLTILPGLSRKGARRALVEAVRVESGARSSGVGAALMAEVESRALAAGASLVQLTTDKSRSRAHAFYDRLGYSPTHIGYKKQIG